jgi:hypothetical protein
MTSLSVFHRAVLQRTIQIYASYEPDSFIFIKTSNISENIVQNPDLERIMNEYKKSGRRTALASSTTPLSRSFYYIMFT